MTPTICLDAGHGGHDPGAVGPTGLREKDVALAVVLLIGGLLARKCTVLYTRQTDVFIPLAERAALANRQGADIFVSIHCNSGPPGQGAGFETWTAPGQTASDWLATDIFESYGLEFPGLGRRMDMGDGDVDKESSFAVLRLTKMAAVLHELEFIHTERGEAWLADTENQRRAAESIARGISDYLKLDSKAVTPPVTVKVPLTEEQRLAEFYTSIRDSVNVDQAVKGLTSQELRELGGYLMRTGATENNVGGDIMGRIIVEGWARFSALKHGGTAL